MSSESSDVIFAASKLATNTFILEDGENPGGCESLGCPATFNLRPVFEQKFDSNGDSGRGGNFPLEILTLVPAVRRRRRSAPRPSPIRPRSTDFRGSENAAEKCRRSARRWQRWYFTRGWIFFEFDADGMWKVSAAGSCQRSAISAWLTRAYARPTTTSTLHR